MCRIQAVLNEKYRDSIGIFLCNMHKRPLKTGPFELHFVKNVSFLIHFSQSLLLRRDPRGTHCPDRYKLVFAPPMLYNNSNPIAQEVFHD